VRWRVRSLDIRQGPRSRIPGELGIRRRDPAARAQNKSGLHLELEKKELNGLERRSKRPPKLVRRRLPRLPGRLPAQWPRRPFRDLNKSSAGKIDAYSKRI
jgi:hypothetical protein